jgi:hypothetical protein
MINKIHLIDTDSNDDLAVAEWNCIRQISSDQERVNGVYRSFLNRDYSQVMVMQVIEYMAGLSEVIRKNQPDLSLTANIMFGNKQWERWSNHQRRRIGKLIASLTRAGLLPFEFEPGLRKSELKHYVLK